MRCLSGSKVAALGLALVAPLASGCVVHTRGGYYRGRAPAVVVAPRPAAVVVSTPAVVGPATPMVVDSVCLFEEHAPGADLQLLERFDFTAVPGAGSH